MKPSRTTVWIGAALRQVVPVIGVCVLGWEPVTVLLFYWLDIVLRVPGWVTFMQRGISEQEPTTTPGEQRFARGLFTFVGLLPLLAVTTIMALGVMRLGSEVLDPLLRAIPQTASEALMLGVAVAMQIFASARALRTREPVPADREDFFAEAKYRYALLTARSLLLLPLCAIAALTDVGAQLAVVALAIALTVYDANPRLFLRLMAQVFHDRAGRSFWNAEDDAAEDKANQDEAASARASDHAEKP